MNIDVETHPVGPTTPQKTKVQISKWIVFFCQMCLLSFVLIFSFKFSRTCTFSICGTSLMRDASSVNQALGGRVRENER